MIIFCFLVLPPFFKDPDIIRAFAAGFVNPYSSGYSVDVFCSWALLLAWIIYDLIL
ncbi:MAG: DUF2834 domain-containing protein [Leptospiraceae bacterium]|nr:DUF2834 domain-containing protein [Leptospiraceae bacterium]